MSQINRIRAALDELRPIIPSPLKAVLFKLYLRRPDLRAKAFKFQWNGQDFWGRAVDFYGSISDVFLEDDYAPILPVLEKLPENPAILDAGANIGSFALYCLSHRPDARIFSIEPEETTYQFLQRNATTSPTGNLPNSPSGIRTGSPNSTATRTTVPAAALEPQKAAPTR